MLRMALIFFILALVSVLFGAYGIAGLSMEIGKLLLGVFLIIAVVSGVVALTTNRKSKMFP